MCLRRPLDRKSRRIFSAAYLCIIASFVLMNFSTDFGHRHSAAILGLRFALLGCAIGLMFWFARRNHGCASRS